MLVRAEQVEIVVEMAGKPEGKGRGRARYVQPKDGRPGFTTVYTPANTRKYEGNLKYAAQQVMAGRAPLDGPLRVTITSHMPVPKSWSKQKRSLALSGLVRPTGKPDWDNLAKAAGDSFNEVVWHDDSQIVEGAAIKVYSERPSLHIIVMQLPLFREAT